MDYTYTKHYISVQELVILYLFYFMILFHNFILFYDLFYAFYYFIFYFLDIVTRRARRTAIFRGMYIEIQISRDQIDCCSFGKEIASGSRFLSRKTRRARCHTSRDKKNKGLTTR